MKFFYTIFFLILSSHFVFSQIVEELDINRDGSSNPDRFYVTPDDRLYFRADNGTDGNGLYVWDENTLISFDTRIGGNDNPNYMLALAGDVYFMAYHDDGVTVLGNELYRTDGTSLTLLTALSGTTAGLVTQDNFTISGGRLFMRMNGGDSSVQLWVFDPAFPAGISNLTDLTAPENNPRKLENPDATGFANPNNVISGMLGGEERLIFETRWGNGTALYLGILDPVNEIYARVETTAALAPMVGLSLSDKNYLLAPDGHYYFEGDDNDDNDELWVTDGTPAGTYLIAEINPGGNSDPEGLTAHSDGLIYFRANDGTTGVELYATDGNTITFIADINPMGDATPSNLFSFAGHLYFSATNGTAGVELWRYDGVTATMVRDINTGAGSSSPEDFTIFEDQLFFTANDGVSRRIWVTDGTEAGTLEAASLFGASENPTDVANLVASGTKLYFSGTASNGNEVFSIAANVLSVDHVATTTADTAYPNPTNGVVFFSKEMMHASYVISDMSGRTCTKGILEDNQLHIRQPSGTYILHLVKDRKTIVKKIVIH